VDITIDSSYRINNGHNVKKIDEKNILIIGANGFITYHLVQRLVNCNLKNFTLVSQNESKYFPEANIIKKRWESLSCNDLSTFDSILFLSSTPYQNRNINYKEEDNKSFQRNFGELCRRITEIGMQQKFIFLSSIGVNNIESSDNERSKYYLTKLELEKILLSSLPHSSLSILRLGNIYGFNQNVHNGVGLVNTIISNTLEKKSTNIFGNLFISRNYLYVKDLVELILNIMNETTTNSVYNIHSKSNLNNLEICFILDKLFIRYLGNKPHLIFKDDKIVMPNNMFVEDPQLIVNIMETIKDYEEYLNQF
jgi:nucleoside-diphosphate-sugar epimerase